jgi:hypothetical protein
MIQQQLQYRALTAPPVIAGRHFDEDALSVFVEGRLGLRESAPLVSHLVDCAACRHNTSQLLRLADELEPETTLAYAPAQPEHGLFQRFFEGLRNRVLNLTGDSEAVFAYHETDAPDKPESDEKQN